MSDDEFPDPWPGASRINGAIQWRMAAWVEGKGWIVTHRSIIYGGHHGEPPMLDGDPQEVGEIVALETKNGVRALLHRAKQ